MSPIVPLTYYCVLVLAASILGGMLPAWFRLTHRGMQIAVSFVAAMMLGVGLLHMLPHAVSEARLADQSASGVETTVMLWVLAGWLTMFFIERFFCFHHHDVESDSSGQLREHDEASEHEHHHHHRHDITWSGAAFGLTIHSLIEGIALAASVYHRHSNLPLAGLGTFLVIVLHKPFDSMTIGMLMTRGGWPVRSRHIVNGVFALAVPAGIGLFYAGLATEGSAGLWLAYSLAFSAGTFLCISLSDLLPELQFHDHDRVTLSIALLLGLGLSIAAGRLEGLVHRHQPSSSSPVSAPSQPTR